MNKRIVLFVGVIIYLTAGCSNIAKPGQHYQVNKERSSPSFSSNSTRLFLTKKRKERYKSKIETKHDSWLFMIDQLDASIDKDVWNKGEYSAAYALAYHNTGEERYLAKAKALFWQAYSDFGYKSINDFRSHNRYAHYTFDWIKHSLNASEYSRYVNLFTRWASYWLGYTGYKNQHFNQVFQNAIETTSLAENFLLLAQSLKNTDAYQKLLTVSDRLLNDYYAEINDNNWLQDSGKLSYHPSYMQYWLRAALHNKNNRNISTANPLAIKLFNYEFDNVKNDLDYSKSRYQLMLILVNVIEDAEIKGLGQFWLNNAIKNNKKSLLSSSETGIGGFLYDQMDVTANKQAKKILLASKTLVNRSTSIYSKTGISDSHNQAHSTVKTNEVINKKANNHSPELTRYQNKTQHSQFSPSTNPLFLSAERLNTIHAKKNNGHASWKRLIKQLGRYITTVPYNSNEFAAGYALAYKIGGNKRYLTRAKEFFLMYYSDWNYKSRNGFRSNNLYAHYIFSWIKEALSVDEIKVYQDLFRTWGKYWLAYIDYENNFAGYRVEDTDETTSLVENLLLLAISLDGSPLASRLYAASDAMLNRFVVDEYMNGHMKGGMWGEGTHYSLGTIPHWVRTFILNKELRGIPYPNKYMEDVILATIHSTYPGYTGMFQYGDVEGGAALDRNQPLSERRYNLILGLIEGVESPEYKALGQSWLDNALTVNKIPDSSSYTGLWRVLFERNEASQQVLPTPQPLNTIFYSSGIEMLAMRDSWEDDATVIYMQAGKQHVDHNHNDALSFNIVSDGKIITKEMTGYGRQFAEESVAHNTLLIEHDDLTLDRPNDYNWGSHLKSRPLGAGGIKIYDAGEDYAYAYADGTQLYNLKWWDRDRKYTHHVSRKLFFIKPETVLVYDNIDLNKQYNPRQIKYIQHFQSQPYLSNGVYSAESEGKVFHFKTLLPTDAVTTVIDERLKNFWGNGVMDINQGSSNEIQDHQLKWHLSVSPYQEGYKTQFINILSFGDKETRVMPDTSVINKRTGNMPTANMVGTHLQEAGKDYVVLFNNNPSDTAPSSAIKYIINTQEESQHFLTGLSANTGYKVSVTKSGSKLTLTIIKGGAVSSNAKGTLVFKISQNGRL